MWRAVQLSTITSKRCTAVGLRHSQQGVCSHKPCICAEEQRTGLLAPRRPLAAATAAAKAVEHVLPTAAAATLELEPHALPAAAAAAAKGVRVPEEGTEHLKGVAALEVEAGAAAAGAARAAAAAASLEPLFAQLHAPGVVTFAMWSRDSATRVQRPRADVLQSA